MADDDGDSGADQDYFYDDDADDLGGFDPDHPNYVFYRTIVNYIRSTKEHRKDHNALFPLTQTMEDKNIVDFDLKEGKRLLLFFGKGRVRCADSQDDVFIQVPLSRSDPRYGRDSSGNSTLRDGRTLSLSARSTQPARLSPGPGVGLQKGE